MAQSTWTDKFLDQARTEGDPLADATVTAIFERGQLPAVNEAFGLLLRNDQLPLEQLPSELQQFLQQTSPLPDWAGPDLISHAQRFFVSWGLLCLASLAAAGLPECYVLADEARVLAITRRLTTQAPRRIIETAQLAVRVMDQGGLGPTGKGIRAIQKVRLLHATMRKLIRMDPPPEAASRSPRDHFEAMAFFAWPPEFGMPISQEHLAYTLLTFSYVVPRSLERFGAPITAQDWTAYLHCWNVVGHVLGLRRDLMTETKEDAELLFARIKGRHQVDTPDGRALTSAVLAWMTGMLPFRCLNWVPPLVVWMLIDPPTASILGVPSPSWCGRLLLAIYRALPFKLEPNVILGRWMVSYLTALPRGWQRGLFDLPDSLQKPWRVERRSPLLACW